MLSDYLELALRTLRRNLMLTALMIAAVGVGIGASKAVLWRALHAASVPSAIATRGLQ